MLKRAKVWHEAESIRQKHKVLVTELPKLLKNRTAQHRLD